MLLKILSRKFHNGCLRLHMPDGRVQTLGSGEPSADIQFNRKGALRWIMMHPELRLGEAYMNGDWEPRDCSLLDVFHVVFTAYEGGPSRGVQAVAKRLWSLVQEMNSAVRSKRNVSRHYDLDGRLFRNFLDEDMQYSCAYFSHPDMTLEEAQTAKREHIARKLVLKPCEEVLDIGCGWGGMALHLAREYGARVTGLTLSEEQYSIGQERARKAGLEQQVQFKLEDYRKHEGSYDAVVSVGMFEHVGRPQYQVYFDTVARLLKPDGRSLIHSIGRTAPPGGANAWMNKYIFPGGYIPSLSEAAERVERSSLGFTDVEVLRIHYAETLASWNARFQKTRAQFVEEMGEEFCRMWEFYLQACEALFRWDKLVVFQMQLSHKNNAVPLTRDYLYSASEAAAGSEFSSAASG